MLEDTSLWEPEDAGARTSACTACCTCMLPSLNRGSVLTLSAPASQPARESEREREREGERDVHAAPTSERVSVQTGGCRAAQRHRASRPLRT